MDLKDEYAAFLRDFAKQTPVGRRVLIARGEDLARRLRDAAIGLCYGKATEFSPDIERYFLYAAEVALLVYGNGSPELAPFEREVFYYDDPVTPGPIVAEYRAFRAGTGGGMVGGPSE